MSAPILILGALEGEIQAYQKASNSQIDLRWSYIKFYKGILDGKNIVFAATGVGKSLAAMATQKAIDTYHPRYILFTGLAGALNPSYQIGDIILAKETMMHDMNVTSLGFERGEIPYAHIRMIPADPTLLQLAQSYTAPQGRICVGRVLTGDTFVSTQHKNELRDELGGDAVEMEGASVALVAHQNQIPHLIIRIISDQADGQAKIDFERFLPQASAQLLILVQHTIQNL